MIYDIINKGLYVYRSQRKMTVTETWSAYFSINADLMTVVRNMFMWIRETAVDQLLLFPCEHKWLISKGWRRQLRFCLVILKKKIVDVSKHFNKYL